MPRGSRSSSASTLKRRYGSVCERPPSTRMRRRPWSTTCTVSLGMRMRWMTRHATPTGRNSSAVTASVGLGVARGRSTPPDRLAGVRLDHPQAARAVQLDGDDVEREHDRAEQAHPRHLGRDRDLFQAGAFRLVHVLHSIGPSGRDAASCARTRAARADRRADGRVRGSRPSSCSPRWARRRPRPRREACWASPPHRRPAALRGVGHAREEVRAALRQACSARRARAKTPHADRLLFTTRGARAGDALAGRDASAPRAGRSPRARAWSTWAPASGWTRWRSPAAGRPVLAVERDPVRARAAPPQRGGPRPRGQRRGVGRRTRTAARFDAAGAFLDPDRRPAGTRTRDARRFEPPVAAWEALLAPLRRGDREGAAGGPREPARGRALRGRLAPRRGARAAAPLARLSRARRRAARSRSPRGARSTARAWPWPAPRAPAPGLALLDPDPAVTLAGLVGDLCARRRASGPSTRASPTSLGRAPVARGTAPGTWLRDRRASSRPRRARSTRGSRRATWAGVEVRCRGVARRRGGLAPAAASPAGRRGDAACSRAARTTAGWRSSPPHSCDLIAPLHVPRRRHSRRRSPRTELPRSLWRASAGPLRGACGCRGEPALIGGRRRLASCMRVLELGRPSLAAGAGMERCSRSRRGS